MTKLDKATDLYLRGFNGEYIKQRTGISVQSLLKQLLSKCIKYDKNDIISYQVLYIKSKYTIDDVIEAYKYIITTFGYNESMIKGKKIHVLGCGFGNYTKVFKQVLGDDVYFSLKNELWYTKQSSIVKERYGVTNIFDKSTFSNFVSDAAIAEGRVKRQQTLIERYGISDINKYEPFLDKMRESQRVTFMAKYGVDNPMKVSNIAKLSAQRRQKVMLKKYGVANSVQSSELMDKIFKSRKKNNTMNTSLPETTMHRMLIDIFGEHDVCYNEIIDDRYPYHVDFYIRSRDLFIELNGDISHGGHWFDENNVSDRHKLESYVNNMECIESETGRASKYRAMIKTWTIKDPEKRHMAQLNRLNYLVFWDGSCKSVKGKRVAKLTDFKKWIEDRYPDSFDWNKNNTY